MTSENAQDSARCRNCLHDPCLFGNLVEYNLIKHGQGMMPVLSNQCLSWVFPVLFLFCQFCEGVRVVIGDEAPLGGVAQVILHGVRVVEVSLQVREHEEGEKEKGRGSAGGCKRRG